MVKAGDITIEVMIIKVNVDVVGVVITIIGDNRIITEAEVTVGICNQIMISKASHTGPMVITVSIPNPNSNIMTSLDQCNRNKWSISVNCVIIKDTLTTNASLQVTLWLEPDKPLIKADNITTKTNKVSGPRETMITKIPMISLFSKGGSRCH